MLIGLGLIHNNPRPGLAPYLRIQLGIVMTRTATFEAAILYAS